MKKDSKGESGSLNFGASSFSVTESLLIILSDRFLPTDVKEAFEMLSASMGSVLVLVNSIELLL